MLIHGDGKPLEALFTEALAAFNWLRMRVPQPVYAANVFVPFGYITVCCFAQKSRELAVTMAMMSGGAFDSDQTRANRERHWQQFIGEHDARVQSLCRALRFARWRPITRGARTELTCGQMFQTRYSGYWESAANAAPDLAQEPGAAAAAPPAPAATA
jgi:hypothetical protein